jgi:hypothetical protein
VGEVSAQGVNVPGQVSLEYLSAASRTAVRIANEVAGSGEARVRAAIVSAVLPVLVERGWTE